MNHLILPEGVKPWIEVPYDAKKEDYYEKFSGGFSKYPERRGWSEDDVWAKSQNDSEETSSEDSNGKSGRTPSDVEQFFQTWLFFGLIIEVLRLGKIEVTTNDFLVPQAESNGKSQVVTTEILPSLITRWRDNHESTRPRETSAFEVAMTIFERVRNILDFFCAGGKKQRSPEQYGQIRWPVRDEITTSIIAVAATLRTAAHQIYDKQYPENLRWPTANSEILRMRIQRKWCRSDAAMVMEDFDIDGQYFIAAAQGHSLEALDKHYKCTEDACYAKVEDGTYAIKHAEGCLGEDLHPEIKYIGHLGPEYDREPKSLVEGVKSIMDHYHLPFVVWNPELRGIETSGYAKKLFVPGKGFATPPFVAISHVWAGGMGNPFHNSLPDCQLDRIQGMVDELCGNHLRHHTLKERPGFWMDTLCCLVGEENNEYREQSIEKMREIYRQAVAVLIIDPWLTAIASTAPMSEICHRIYMSAWARRLWTHQEGYLGDEVFYQLQDKPISLSKIHTRTIQFEAISAAKGQPVMFPNRAQGKTGTYYKAIKAIISSISEGPINTDNRWIAYKDLAESLAYRSTTKIEDEIACVASIMGIPVEPYLKIRKRRPKEAETPKETPKTGEVIVETSEDVAELRMVRFLKEINRFRQGIIFNNYRRLKTPGFRWAPASMLGHRSSGFGDMDKSEAGTIIDFSKLDPNDNLVEFSSLGMKLDLNKLATNKALSWTPPARYLSMKLNGKDVEFPPFGLPVKYPGYIIKFSRDRDRDGHKLTVNMAERRFAIKTTPVKSLADNVPPASVSIEMAPPLQKVAPSSTGKTTPSSSSSSFGKASLSLSGRVPSFGKTSSSSSSENKSPSTVGSNSTNTTTPFFGLPRSPSLIQLPLKSPPPVVTIEHVVFVDENNVQWKAGVSYALILQKPLVADHRNGNEAAEVKAMIGRSQPGPGLTNWVESLCSAVVRRVKARGDEKMKFGLDIVEVGEVRRDWVIT